MLDILRSDITLKVIYHVYHYINSSEDLTEANSKPALKSVRICNILFQYVGSNR